MSERESKRPEAISRPRLRIPLYVQVLIWFGANLFLLCAALLLISRLISGVSFWDFFEEQQDSRLERQADLVAAALRETGAESWGELLLEKGKALDVSLAVLDLNGKWYGASEALTASLKKQASDELRSSFPLRELSEIEREDSFSNKSERPPESGKYPRPPRLEAEVVFLNGGEGGLRRAGVIIDLTGKPYYYEPRAILVFEGKARVGNEIFLARRPLIFTAIGLLVLSGLLWMPFAFSISRHLSIMTRGAEKISEGNFQVQVARRRGDEIGRLSRAIQRMAGRLEVLVDGQKRFLGDTAHELCSPLVRIRMGLGVLEHRLEGEDERRLQEVSQDVGELARLVDELLAFSKASLTKGRFETQQVSIPVLCEQVVSCETLGFEMELSVPKNLEMETSENLLRRALGNLVRNAARYGEGKELALEVSETSEKVIFLVLDRGPGLPEGWIEKIFEPFARPEKARTREGGGAGLGLAIVKAAAEALEGQVSCRNRDGGGLEVKLELSKKISEKRSP